MNTASRPASGTSRTSATTARHPVRLAVDGGVVQGEAGVHLVPVDGEHLARPRPARSGRRRCRSTGRRRGARAARGGRPGSGRSPPTTTARSPARVNSISRRAAELGRGGQAQLLLGHRRGDQVGRVLAAQPLGERQRPEVRPPPARGQAGEQLRGPAGVQQRGRIGGHQQEAIATGAPAARHPVERMSVSQAGESALFVLNGPFRGLTWGWPRNRPNVSVADVTRADPVLLRSGAGPPPRRGWHVFPCAPGGEAARAARQLAGTGDHVPGPDPRLVAPGAVQHRHRLRPVRAGGDRP